MTKLLVFYWLFNTCFGFLERRIIGGIETTLVPPWIVLLSHKGKIDCGGVLYTKSLVITVAHCNKGIINDWKAHVSIQKAVPKIKGGVSYKILNRFNHIDYKKIDGKMIYDISVWWIKGKSNKFTEVKLDDGTQLLNLKSKIRILGWGNIKARNKNIINLSEFIKEFPEKLKIAEVLLMNEKQCQELIKKEFTVSNYCSGWGGNNAYTSNGDSGGPVYRLDGNNIILMGIISSSTIYTTNDSFNVHTKISESSITNFINKYVPLFTPKNARSEKIKNVINDEYYSQFYQKKYGNLNIHFKSYLVSPELNEPKVIFLKNK